jgi:predicted XRE-type DNA-binding protein
MFRDILRCYGTEEKMGLYSVNVEEMRKLKQRQILKSLNLSQPRTKNVPFKKLLERAKSIEKK